MNKVFFAMMPWLFAAIGYKATAQEVREIIVEGKPGPTTETREIIVRKKGDKNTIVTIEFKDDKVLINGKPLVEFKDDEISINNRKIVINGEFMAFNDMERQFKDMELQFKNLEGMKVESLFGSKTFLGVTTEKNEKGALIENVTKESAAEKAGLKEGDIITKVNDTKIDGPEKLAEVIGKMKPNEEVKITYKRGTGKDKTVKATLQERKENGSANFSFSMPKGNTRSVTVPRRPAMPRGMTVPDNGYQWNDGEKNIYIQGFSARPKLGLKIQDLEEGEGVKVLEVENETPAAKAGLQKDDIITQIAGVKVLNTDDAREQLSINAEKSSYTINAKRNNADMKFEIRIPKKLKTVNL